MWEGVGEKWPKQCMHMWIKGFFKKEKEVRQDQWKEDSFFNKWCWHNFFFFGGTGTWTQITQVSILPLEPHLQYVLALFNFYLQTNEIMFWTYTLHTKKTSWDFGQCRILNFLTLLRERLTSPVYSCRATQLLPGTNNKKSDHLEQTSTELSQVPIATCPVVQELWNEYARTQQLHQKTKLWIISNEEGEEL
jgi:hypothetical protein